MPSTFDLHEVAGGVWAAVAPGTAGPAVSNAAIVDLGDRTLVVDTFMTVRAAAELAREAERLTGRRPFLVINTHWHSDHVRGNRVFDHAPIVGTSRMAELMIEDAPTTPEEFATRAQAVHQMAETALANAVTDEERTRAHGVMHLAEALLEEVGSYRLVLPSVLVGERLDLAGERPAVVLSFGRGHTESDLFVHLPDGDVLIAGDLVWTGIHPKLDDGYPQEWAGVLDRLGQLDVRHVIPGHGAVGAAGDITTMAGYVHQVARMLEAVSRGELDPEDAAPPLGAEDWQDVARFRAGLQRLGGHRS